MDSKKIKEAAKMFTEAHKIFATESQNALDNVPDDHPSKKRLCDILNMAKSGKINQSNVFSILDELKNIK